MKRLFLKIFQNKKLAVGLAIVCTAIIFIACLTPSSRVPKVNVPMMDKWVHFLAFGGFAFAWACTLKKAGFINLLALVAMSVFTGWIIELLQMSGITRGRSYENMDIVADGIGGLLGIAFFAIMYRVSRKDMIEKDE